MNYLLATWIVTIPAGSTAFNEELGRLTLLSYPLIAIPSMLMMLAIFYYLWRTIHDMTGFTIEETLASLLRRMNTIMYRIEHKPHPVLRGRAVAAGRDNFPDPGPSGKRFDKSTARATGPACDYDVH